MIILHWLTGTALAFAQAAALPNSPPAPGPPPASATVVVPMDGFSLGKQSESATTRTEAAATSLRTEAATTPSKCGGRRFETSAEGMIDGKMKRRRITLCAAPGENDGQWTVRLENAIVWVRAQKDLSDPVKNQLIAELRGEIARGKARSNSLAPASSALPAADALVATVPPMPPPLPSPALSASSLRASPQPARLPLTIRCLAAGERGAGGPCDRLYTDTVFAVHADTNLASPAVLRFLRRGETRAEVLVAALRQGQTMRVKLPSALCSRVTGTVVTIQVLARNSTNALPSRVADEVGPFRLRC